MKKLAIVCIMVITRCAYAHNELLVKSQTIKTCLETKDKNHVERCKAFIMLMSHVGPWSSLFSDNIVEQVRTRKDFQDIVSQDRTLSTLFKVKKDGIVDTYILTQWLKVMNDTKRMNHWVATGSIVHDPATITDEQFVQEYIENKKMYDDCQMSPAWQQFYEAQALAALKIQHAKEVVKAAVKKMVD